MPYSSPSSYPYPWSLKTVKEVETYLKQLQKSMVEADSRRDYYRDRSPSSDLKALIVRPEWYGAIGDGTHDDTVAIQAAADAALADGKWLQFGPETYRVSSTITIKCNVAPNTGELYIYGHPSPAVAIGTLTAGASIQDKQIWLPKITSKTYAGAADWSAENVGVVVYGMYQCDVHTQEVWGFKYGLHLYADAVGISYNNFYIGVLRGNQIALYLERVTSGWVNENNFYGGRYRIDGSEGTVETVDQVALDRAPAVTNTTTVIISTTDSIGGTQTGANDAYNGWYLYNRTRGAGAVVSDTVYDAGNAELTFTLATEITGQVATDAIELMNTDDLYDARYIKMGKSTLNTGNNNVFYKPSLEGGGPRYHIEIYGNYNLFLSPRTEVSDAHFRIHYGTTTGSSYSQGNILLYPFGGETLDIDEDTSPVASANNHVLSFTGTVLGVSQGAGSATMTLRNGGSNAHPCLHILETGVTTHADHTSDWSGQWTAATLQLKDDTDAYGTVQLTGGGGSVYVGDGTADPTAGVYASGAATCVVAKASDVQTRKVTMAASAERHISHAGDDQGVYLDGGSSYTKGASVQVFGKDTANDGSVYIVSGSSDASNTGYIELAHRDNTGYHAQARLTHNANLDLGGATTWAAATTNAIAQFIGVAPSSSQADSYVQYASNSGADGTACPTWETEAGDIVKLYSQAHIADLATDYSEDNTRLEIITALNATNVAINSILAVLETNGLLKTS